MRLANYIIVILTSIVLFSCNSKSKINIEKTKEIKINIRDKEKIKKPFRFSYYGGVVKLNSLDYIYCINFDKNNIDFYSITSTENFTIKLDSSIINDGKDAYYHLSSNNDNKIYLFFYPNKIFELNINGNLINEIDINRFNSKIKSPEMITFYQQPCIIEGNNVYLNITFNTSTYLEHYNIDKIDEETVFLIQTDFPLIANISLINQEIDYFIYRPKYLIDYAASSSNSFVVQNDNVTVSFNKSDTLYIYNNNNLSSKIVAKSRYVDEFKKLQKSDLLNFNKSRKYAIEEPRYISLIEDKKNNLFYRIARHRASYLVNEETIRGSSDADWSIMFLDNSLNIIDEKLFDFKKEKYLVYPYNGGFVTLKNDKENITFNVYQVSVK